MVSVIPNNVLSSLPKGSSLKIDRESDDCAVLSLPRMSISVSHFFQLLFISVWFSITLFITWLIYLVWPAGVFLSFPLWVVEISTVTGLLNAFYEKQTLTINSSHLIIRKKRPFFSEKLMIQIASINHIAMMPLPSRFSDVFIKPKFMWKQNWSGNHSIFTPAIQTDLGVIYFFETADEKEQKWIIALLNRKLDSYK
jgi:hypothetical protein